MTPDPQALTEIPKYVEFAAGAGFTFWVFKNAVDVFMKIRAAKNGNGKENKRSRCVASREWVLHDRTTDDTKMLVSKLVDSEIKQTNLLGRVAESNENQEQLLRAMIKNGMK